MEKTEKTSQLGMNRTGMDMAKDRADDMVEGATFMPTPPSDGIQANQTRADYVGEADPIGTVPMPGTLKGMAVSMKDKIMGNKPEVLIDKLGERLAFERSGVRLYELFITKCETSGTNLVDLEMVRHIKDEEANHFKLVEQEMRNLGADPTSETPAADVMGVASKGLFQVVSDPRTTIPQCLGAMLTAELVDTAAWELLTEMADGMGLSDTAERFRAASREEDEHLVNVRRWHHQAIMAESGAA